MPVVNQKKEREKIMREEMKTNDFAPAVFPADILYDSNLDSTERLVLLILFTYTNAHTNTAWPSYQTIADRAGLKKRGTIYIVERLIKKGYIQKKEQYQKPVKGGKIEQTSNLYTLFLKPRPLENRGGSASNALGGSASNALGVVHQMHPPGASDAPELSIGTIHIEEEEEEEEEEDKKKFEMKEEENDGTSSDHQMGNGEEKQIEKYRYLAERENATDEDLAKALEYLKEKPGVKNPIAVLTEAIKREKSSRELAGEIANHPKTEKKLASKRTAPRSTRAKADMPTTTKKDKYEKFYL
jgi:hypothetical protein